jgi:nucleosome binding factor SPN SPT16 subunit
LSDHLKVGKKISEVYESTISLIKSLGKEDHLKHLPKVLGYGIGLNKKEEQLSIKSDNHRIIEPGMIFNLRVSMANFDNRPTRNCLLVADTILMKEISESAPCLENLTRSIPKAYADVSYSIDENDEDLPEEEKVSAPRKPKAEQIDSSSIIKPGVGVI